MLRSSVVRQPVQLGERELAPVGPHGRAEREQGRGRVGRVRRGAEVVREDRVLAVLALARVAAVAAVEPAREREPPVPAPGRLEEVAADRPHVPELRRGREPARLPQRRRHLRVGLELGERRPGADPERTLWPEPRLRRRAARRRATWTSVSAPNEPVAESAARARCRRRARGRRARERLDGLGDGASGPELQPSRSPVPAPRAARAGSPRGSAAATRPRRPSRRGSRSRSRPRSG